MSTEIPVYGVLKSVTTEGAVVRSYEVVGGYHSVKTIAERDSLKPSLLYNGMMVYVSTTNQLFVLKEDLITWKEVATNGIVTETFVWQTTPVPTARTIILVNFVPGGDFEHSVCAYVDAVSGQTLNLAYAGKVYPANIPPNCTFGDTLYINQYGTIFNNLNTAGKYKKVGIVVPDTVGNKCVILSLSHEEYTIR